MVDIRFKAREPYSFDFFIYCHAKVFYAWWGWSPDDGWIEL